MEQKPTKEEVDRRTRDLARRLMSNPPQPRVKPNAEASGDAFKPTKRGRVTSASPPDQTFALCLVHGDRGALYVLDAQL